VAETLDRISAEVEEADVEGVVVVALRAEVEAVAEEVMAEEVMAEEVMVEEVMVEIVETLGALMIDMIVEEGREGVILTDMIAAEADEEMVGAEASVARRGRKVMNGSVIIAIRK
jgi:hypothetical protein